MITFLTIKAEVGSRGCPYVGTNGEIWPKIKFPDKWQKNGVKVAWSSFLSIAIIAIVFTDNIFVDDSSFGVKGSPLSRHK